MKKAVIFDLDGTLIDSLPDIALNVNLTLKHFGKKPISIKKVKSFIGDGAKDLIFRAFDKSLTDSALAERLEYYNSLYSSSTSPNTKLFDGITNLLTKLCERGYILALLSNKPSRTIAPIREGILKGLNFDIIQGACERFPLKPNPQSVLSIINELGVSCENAYLVGDGDTDVQTAINANINGIAVLWGYRTKTQLKKAGAKVFVKSPQQLLEILS